MTLSNQILKALRHGVAKNGKIVMERMSVDSIASSLCVDIEDVHNAVIELRRADLIGADDMFLDPPHYWRKGKGCV